MTKASCKRIVCAMVLVVLASACAPSPTQTLEAARSPTLVPTVVSATATVAMRPPTATSTLAPLPYLLGEIALGSMPDVGRSPYAAAILEDRLYVANRTTDNVSVIEGGKVVAVIDVGDAPTALVADLVTEQVYVANEGDRTISVLTGYQVLRTIELDESPACLAVSNHRLYVGFHSSNDLLALDAASGAEMGRASLKDAMSILALAIHDERQLAYASVFNSVQVVDLNALAVVGELRHDVYVTLGVDEVNDRLLCAEYDSATSTQYLVAYDALATRELGRVAVGGDPRGLSVDSDRDCIYVANSYTNDLSIILASSLKAVARVTVGLRPWAVAVGPQHEVYVCCPDADSVAVVDGQQAELIGTIPVCVAPAAMAVDEETGRLYVAVPGANSVFAVDGDAIAALPTGVYPSELSLSADGSRLFVLNYVSGDLAVVSTSSKQVVGRTEVGLLPTGLFVPPGGERLFVSSKVLDGSNASLVAMVDLPRDAMGQPIQPVSIQVDRFDGWLFALAHNGVPGSNAGLVIYTIDLATGKQADVSLGGFSTTAMVLDAEGHRLYSTASRMGLHRLLVDDLTTWTQVGSASLTGYPVTLAYNAHTHHLFACLYPVGPLDSQEGPELVVLDSRGLGLVARLPLPRAAAGMYRYSLAVDQTRDRIYVGDAQRGSVYVVADTLLPAAATLQPSKTATPWPTLTARP